MANYTVAVKLGMRTKAVTIEAEDALVAALKIKLENPEALLTTFASLIDVMIVVIRMKAYRRGQRNKEISIARGLTVRMQTDCAGAVTGGGAGLRFCWRVGPRVVRVCSSDAMKRFSLAAERHG
jgi:hypothetical protein